MKTIKSIRSFIYFIGEIDSLQKTLNFSLYLKMDESIIYLIVECGFILNRFDFFLMRIE